jgi:D-alanyl-D-alanine carboxypeptidase (penicillin-binding protein 5/6)
MHRTLALGHRARGAVFVALLIGLLLWLPVAPAAAAPLADDPPDITASVGIVVEYPSGRILYDKNMHQRRAEASTTKIMTALLVLSRARLSDEVQIIDEDQVGESTMGLVPGETQTVENLLYGLMLPSGNDAAMALARYVGTSLTEPAEAKPVDRFVALMNRTAQQMGLADTHFVNPHGFDDPDHYTSAYDLASITWYALHDPEFNKIVSTQYWEAPRHPLANTNEMLTRYDGADGVKTGWTDPAGLCLVASATRGERRLIAVELNAVRWWDDSTAMLDYGFAQPPTDAQNPGPVLNIAYRAQLLWFLATGLPTPLPVAPTALPTPVETAPALAAGGGPGAPLADDPTPEAVVSPTPADSPVSAPSTTEDAIPPATAVQGQQEFSWLPWVLAALLLIGLLVYTRSRRHPEPRPLTTTGTTATAAPAAPPPPAPAARQTVPPAESRAAPQAATDPAAVVPLDLDPAPAANPQSAIRNPQSADPRPWRVSLLANDDPTLHAQRAMAMAARGQEGTSLAEFLMTLDINPEFEFDAIPGFYDMPPAGYMALARAYSKRERPRYARALLRLALEQYPNDPHIAHFLAALNTEAQQ